MGISQVDGWTVVTHTATAHDSVTKSRISYVDPTYAGGSEQYYEDGGTNWAADIGSDPFNPTGTVKAYTTIAAAIANLRNNEADWVLIKKGITINERLGDIRKPGYSDTERTVISTYGSGDRPVLNCGGTDPYGNDTHGLSTFSGWKNFCVIGLHFYAYLRDPDSGDFVSAVPAGIGIYCLVNGDWDYGPGVLIEDVCVQAFSTGMTFQGAWTTDKSQSGVTVRRCVIIDSFSGGAGHSSGMYVAGVDGLTLEDNVIDHNGWYGNRDTGSGSYGGATVFNHGVYIDNENPISVNTRDERDHISLTGNIVSRSASHGLYIRPGGTASDNLLIQNAIAFEAGGGDGYTTSSPNGVYCSIVDNVVLRSVDITTSLPRGWFIECVNILVLNILRNLGAWDAGTTGTLGIDLYGGIDGTVTITDNVTYEWTAGGADERGLTIDTEERNKWWDWAVSGTNTKSEDATFIDATRDEASYMGSLGETATFEAFIAACRGNQKNNWDDRYTAAAANEWIRVGYNMGTLSGAVPTMVAALL